ncbi:MAG: ATP-dependent chaperone ClpB, partial [Alphaproteobacteria bacterium]|nr:ATP-dependent chaperone ClpB [Alphaproteobacteria bacterium]
MNPAKYTDRSKGFIQAAQSFALGEGHPRFEPIHLLKCLLDDAEGLADGLIRAAGGDAMLARREIESALAGFTKVSGSGAQLTMAPDMAKVFTDAEKKANQAGDQFVSIERFLQALLAIESKAAQILQKCGLQAEPLANAIAQLRKGRVADSASAEEGYDALKKYARDVTEDARAG